MKPAQNSLLSFDNAKAVPTFSIGVLDTPASSSDSSPVMYFFFQALIAGVCEWKLSAFDLLPAAFSSGIMVKDDKLEKYKLFAGN